MACTHTVCPPAAAKCKAVLPALLDSTQRAVGFGAYSRKHFTTATCPCFAARCSGRSVELFFCGICSKAKPFEDRFNKARAVVSWPSLAAQCRGAIPSALTAWHSCIGSGANSKSMSTTSLCPCTAAKWRPVWFTPEGECIAISCCRAPAAATPSRQRMARAFPALHMVCRRKVSPSRSSSRSSFFNGSLPSACRQKNLAQLVTASETFPAAFSCTSHVGKPLPSKRRCQAQCAARKSCMEG
mmetsp:Transcript_110966/g.264717  ORF Transcript_110966/g.264717 Transcript_110966/m.264717 type:complete len:242 (-) Transcript_110966:57-782(-)